jgi:hypothetical protein
MGYKLIEKQVMEQRLGEILVQIKQSVFDFIPIWLYRKQLSCKFYLIYLLFSNTISLQAL